METTSTAACKIPYVVHQPKLSTILTLQHFHYFKLYLFDIPLFLPTKIYWNKDYPAAQSIYSNNPVSIALRKSIQTEHSILYSNRKGRSNNVVGDLERTPKSLFNLLREHCASTTNHLELQIYTYSILEKSMRFSRTGQHTVDILSKHSLHASGSDYVLAAGEFWVDDDVLYIDNNSGTFAPPKTVLPLVKGLLENSFPGIKVVALDYQDDEWKQRRNKV